MSLMSLLAPMMPKGIGATAAPAAATPVDASAPPAAATDGARLMETGGAQATLGAAAVQPTPPKAGKIIVMSTIRGAITGATSLFSLKTFAPGILGKVLSFIPLIPKVSMPMGTLVALGAGAAVGAVFGLIGGIRQSRKAAAQYVKDQQAALEQASQPQAPATTPVGAPVVIGPDGKPVPVDPTTNVPAAGRAGSAAPPTPMGAAGAAAAIKKSGAAKKNPTMPYGYTSSKKAAAAKAKRKKRAASLHREPSTRHHIKRGDTLWALSRKYGTTIDKIVAANRGKIKDPNLIYAGDTIVIPG